MVSRNITSSVTFSRPVLFWVSVLAIIGGVASHIPMFMHSAANGYRMAGMPLDETMIAGMFAIFVGAAGAFCELLPC